jgi:glycosyltransferase involved in cell wall biosynthesis
MKQQHLLLVVNSDWFFLSHRLPIALAAKDAGMRVTVAAIDTGAGDTIRRHGLEFRPLQLTTRGMNPLGELSAIAGLCRMYRELRPDIVHHVTIKPVIYGSIAAKIVGGMAVVNAISGLGYVFTEHAIARALRPVVTRLYRFALSGKRSRTIFQNPDDREQFVRRGLVDAAETYLIRGSGADVDVFRPSPEKVGGPVVILPSRMIWDKGIAEFVAAAGALRDQYPEARFALVGKPDRGNPKAVPEDQLAEWSRAGVVEWWGHRPDMPAVFAESALVVLPSTYPEGVPKVLIEAAAAGRPIVTTDTPGCREVVRHGVNGLLVPCRDTENLAAAIGYLLAGPEERARMGAAGREIATAEFSLEGVVQAHMEIYNSLLPPTGRASAAGLAGSI